MTEEEIKQKAEAEADKVIIGKGMDRASVVHLKHLLVTMYVQGANIILSQLTEKDTQIHDLKNDYEMLDNCNLIHENEIKELEDKLANAEYQLEGRENEIKELEKRCNELFFQVNEQAEQINKITNRT